MSTKSDNKDFEELSRTAIESVDQDNKVLKQGKGDNKGNNQGSILLEDIKQQKRFSFGRLFSLVIIILSIGFIGVGGAFVYNILAAASETTGGGAGNVWDTLTSSFNPQGFERVEMKGEAAGRTNMLVMGVDSVALLADTIMIVSYYHNEQQIATMSIPRDFYVAGGYRINAIYPFAEQGNPGSGAQAMADFVSAELDIPIHYWTVVNFEGVEQVVDAVGGITIDVTVPFVDYEFPTRDYSGYIRPAPSFEAGMQQMDGELALIYARSRKGNNGTGSDYDRARRQAEVGEALLQKLKDQIDSGEILNINSINALISSARNNVKTSAKINEIMSAYEIFKEIAENQEDIFSNYYSINWQSGNGFICTPPIDRYGASVVTYCDGAIGGTSGYSASRERGRQQAKNLLQESKFAELAKTSAIILANQSDLTPTVESELRNLPIGTVWPADNFYSFIDPATGDEEVVFYIADKEVRQQFEESAKGNLTFEYKIEGALPADKTLTVNNQGADIIAWVD